MAMCRGRDLSAKDGARYRLNHVGALLQGRRIGQMIGRSRLGGRRMRLSVDLESFGVAWTQRCLCIISDSTSTYQQALQDLAMYLLNKP
jgi:hypothetical protein